MNAGEEVNRIDQANEVKDTIHNLFALHYPEFELAPCFGYDVAHRLYELGYRKVEP